MNVALDPSLENRLSDVARQQAVTVDELVRQVLTDYIQRAEDDPALWVRVTQANLANVWPHEDFSGWGPPNFSQPAPDPALLDSRAG